MIATRNNFSVRGRMGRMGGYQLEYFCLHVRFLHLGNYWPLFTPRNPRGMKLRLRSQPPQTLGRPLVAACFLLTLLSAALASASVVSPHRAKSVILIILHDADRLRIYTIVLEKHNMRGGPLTLADGSKNLYRYIQVKTA